MIKSENFPKISLNVCYFELLEEFSRDSKNEFESATVNEPSVFQSLKFYSVLELLYKRVHYKNVSKQKCHTIHDFIGARKDMPKLSPFSSWWSGLAKLPTDIGLVWQGLLSL